MADSEGAVGGGSVGLITRVELSLLFLAKCHARNRLRSSLRCGRKAVKESLLQQRLDKRIGPA